jgi:hypothetical protein
MTPLVPVVLLSLCLSAICDVDARAVRSPPLPSSVSSTASKGYLDVVVDCGADPSGSSDSIAALQDCVHKAYRYGGTTSSPLWPVPLFFPLGLYTVSDTLNLTQSNPGPDDGVNVCPARFLSLAAFGSSSSPGRRPVLRLAPSSPGFASPLHYKPVVHIWQSQGGEGVDMNNVWKGVDLDLTAEGNPSAAGVQHAGAQGATVTDTAVRALPSSFACFAGLNGAGGEHSNIACYGARYGVYADDSQPVPVLVGATLINQSISAIAYLSQESLSLVAVHIVTHPTAAGPAITSHGGNRGISIIDSAIECTSQTQVAVITPASLYARDLYVRGCGSAILQSSTAPLPGPEGQGWLHVQEWARGTDNGQYFFSNVVYQDGQRLINASIRSSSLLSSSQAPPSDLQSRHVWDSSAQAGVDSPGVNNAKTDCGAKGDDLTDDTAALQACLNRFSAVFLPPGRYRISDTLNVRAGGSIVGMGSSFSFLLAVSAGFPNSSATSPAPLLRTASADAAGPPTTIALLGLLTWQHLAHVYTIDWRSQHPLSLYRSNFDTRECECLWTSAYQRLSPPDLPCSLPVNLTIPKAVFRGLGRIHSFVNDDTGHILSTSSTYRAIRIADTSAFATAYARTRFYSLNLEHAQSEANGEVANATFVDIYSVKAEGNMPILWIRGDVANVSVLCLGGGFTAWPMNWTFPSDFAPATPSALRVDSGARNVTLALLQDHGFAQSTFWPPTGGGCKWNHHYPFPGAHVKEYPYWTFPNVTMFNCWYGVQVSNAYWTMVWSPALGASKPGDKPVVWRLGTEKSASLSTASLSANSFSSTPSACYRPSTTRVFSPSSIALWRLASSGSASLPFLHHTPVRPIEVRVNGWSTTSPSGLLDLVLDSSSRSLRFSWQLSEEKEVPELVRRRGVRQLGYSVHLQRMHPLAIARRAAAVRRARAGDETGQNATSLADALSVDFCSSSRSPAACSCLWDSGLVMSASSLDVEVSAVVSLQPTSMCQWCIQYHSSSGTVSDWTCGVFRTDVSSASPTFPHSPAVWIGSADDTFPVNEVRREFVLPSFEWPTASDLARWTASSLSHAPPFPISAVASVTGVGYYQLWLNGKRVDPTRQLDPTWTAYERRVYFASFDVLQLLRAGGNCVGALLGGGWFSKAQHFAWQLPKPDYGSPRFLLNLNVTFSNGSSLLLVSDRQWQGRRGAVLWDTIYHGEMADGRLLRPGWAEHGFQDNASMWRGVDEMPSPGGELTLTPINPVRPGPGNLHVKVRREHALQPPNVIGAPVTLPDGYLHAVNVSTPIRSVHVFDLGQNFAGWVRIFMKGSAGWPVILRYGEALLTLPADQSTHVLQASFRGATQTDTYVLRGEPEGEWYEPQTTYHGFRYVAVFRPYEEGLTATQVIGVPLHTETALEGSFVSSSRIINQVQHNLLWSMLSQMQGVFTDCPSRDERMGWMDDYLLTSDQGLYNFDLHAFYAAALQQMDDGQLATGNYADTTPVMLTEDGDPNW